VQGIYPGRVFHFETSSPPGFVTRVATWLSNGDQALNSHITTGTLIAVHILAMKVLISLLFTTMLALPSHGGAASEALPKGIRYSEIRLETAKLHGIKQETAKKALAAGLQEESGFDQFLGVDFVAVSPDGQKFLMMIQGVEAEPTYRNRLYSVGSMFVYHTSIRGQPVALGFRNFNTREIDRIVRSLSSPSIAAYHGRWTHSLFSLLLSSSLTNADQIATGELAPPSPVPNKWDKIAECVSQGGKGGWDSFLVPLDRLYSIDDSLTDRLKGNANHLIHAGPRQYWRDNVEDFWRRVSEVPEMWKAFKAPLQAATTADFLEKLKSSWPKLSSFRPGLHAFCRRAGQLLGQAEMLGIPVYASYIGKDLPSVVIPQGSKSLAGIRSAASGQDELALSGMEMNRYLEDGTRIPFRELEVTDTTNPAIKAALDNLRKIGIREVGLAHAAEESATPGAELAGYKWNFGRDASSYLFVPKSALSSNESLLGYLNQQYKLAYQNLKQVNASQTAQLEPETAGIMNKVFDTRLQVTHIVPHRELGMADGQADVDSNVIRINASDLKPIDRSPVLQTRTALHETTHRTSDLHMTPKSNPVQSGRLIQYNFKESTGAEGYEHRLRADEFEARVREWGYLRNKRHYDMKKSNVPAQAEYLRSLQNSMNTKFLQNFKDVKISVEESYSTPGVDTVVADLNGDYMRIPLPRQTLKQLNIDASSYAKMVIERRAKYLESYKGKMW
jgi:hypothetical protein